jgi:hypothetical protein
MYEAQGHWVRGAAGNARKIEKRKQWPVSFDNKRGMPKTMFYVNKKANNAQTGLLTIKGNTVASFQTKIVLHKDGY